ncbi:MAG: CYTH domain-containing protein, partial [Rubrivivax sp.]
MPSRWPPTARRIRKNLWPPTAPESTPPLTAADVEIELKFLVPAAFRAALVAELGARGTSRRISLVDAYFDTPDRRLARAGLAWRIRREGGRWVQGLKASSNGALARFEHEVIRPDARLDPQAHAATAPRVRTRRIRRRCWIWKRS